METWEWTARQDYVYCYLSYFGYKHGKRTMDGFWDAIARLGVDDNPYRAGFLQLVGVSESDAQAESDYAPHVHYFYQKCLNVWEGFAEAPGYRTLKSLQAGSRPQVGFLAKQIRKALTWKDYVEQGYIIAGSPATVREQLTDCIRTLRVGHLMVLLQIGSLPRDLTLKNIELFSREVLPHLRDLWTGYKDRWWPSGASQAVPNA